MSDPNVTMNAGLSPVDLAGTFITTPTARTATGTWDWTPRGVVAATSTRATPPTRAERHRLAARLGRPWSARQAQETLRDDVALDLCGTAVDGLGPGGQPLPIPMTLVCATADRAQQACLGHPLMRGRPP